MRKRDRDRYDSIVIQEVHVQVFCDADISECISDSIILAFREKRKVICRHNNKVFTIVPTDIITTIHDEYLKTETEVDD